MKKALLFALALQLSGSALAASSSDAKDKSPKWYQADLVVFRYLNSDSSEAWPPVAQHPLRSGTLSLKNNAPVKPEPLSGSIVEPADSTATPVAPDLARDPFCQFASQQFSAE